jgi:hypothetical protein
MIWNIKRVMDEYGYVLGECRPSKPITKPKMPLTSRKGKKKGRTSLARDEGGEVWEKGPAALTADGRPLTADLRISDDPSIVHRWITNCERQIIRERT